MSDAAPRVNIFKERVFPILFMFLVTVVFIATVSGIYLSTRERVTRNEQLFMKNAVLFAAGISLPEEPAEQERLYNERIDEFQDDEGNIDYYAVSGDGGSRSCAAGGRTGGLG